MNHDTCSFLTKQVPAFETAFQLPSGIAPNINLTALLCGQAAAQPSIYGDDLRCARLFEQLTRALGRSSARHILLVGERGVGQGPLLAELALRSVQGTSPTLSGRTVLSIDCRHTAPEASREQLSGILTHLADHPEVVAGIDGFANLLRAERGNNKAFLLAALHRVSCNLIGLISPRAYQELIADDLEMQEMFVKIEVPEPDLPLATRLVSQYARGLSQQFGISIEPEAVQGAVTLSANYILNQRLPGKALKLLQRACEDLQYERTEHGATQNTITIDDIYKAVSDTSGVPEETLRGIAQRSDFERSLSEVVVGQPHVVREIANELGLIKAGLTDPTKPATVIMFVGQTGTGKTEMAKAMARLYSNSKRLRTYTLGNFVESHSVSGIIGVPPGYVGHDAGGQLVNDLNADPYGVFLLDEADKAHPDVLQPFLNLFDEGWLVDQRGVPLLACPAVWLGATVAVSLSV